MRMVKYMMKKVIYYLKESLKMDLKMGMEKNIVRMVIYYLKVNILMK